MKVTKKSGDVEDYNPDKLCQSIEVAGAPKHIAEQICTQVGDKLGTQVTTSKIFRHTVRQLLRDDVDSLARYSIRRALDDLGPTGFLFEQFVESLLQAYEYTTERNVIMQGECVSHEVDVLAHKNNFHFIIEAKYHNDHNLKTSIDKVMYADARYMDIVRRLQAKESNADKQYSIWIITNTRFTQKSIDYALCRNVKLLGWNYPEESNLEEMIVRKKMYPITILPSLTRYARDVFTDKDMILAQDILPYSVDQLENDFNINPTLGKKLLKEAQRLLT